jgi:hypothetical protein
MRWDQFLSAYKESNKHLYKGSPGDQRIPSPQPGFTREANSGLDSVRGVPDYAGGYGHDTKTSAGSQQRQNNVYAADQWNHRQGHEPWRQVPQAHQQWRASQWVAPERHAAANNVDHTAYETHHEDQNPGTDPTSPNFGIPAKDIGTHGWQRLRTSEVDHAEGENEIVLEGHEADGEECWEDDEEHHYEGGWVQKNKRVRRVFVPAVNVDPECLRCVCVCVCGCVGGWVGDPECLRYVCVRERS